MGEKASPLRLKEVRTEGKSVRIASKKVFSISTFRSLFPFPTILSLTISPRSSLRSTRAPHISAAGQPVRTETRGTARFVCGARPGGRTGPVYDPFFRDPCYDERWRPGFAIAVQGAKRHLQPRPPVDIRAGEGCPQSCFHRLRRTHFVAAARGRVFTYLKYARTASRLSIRWLPARNYTKCAIRQEYLSLTDGNRKE